MGLEAEQARRIGEHRARIGLGEPLAAQQVEEDFGMAARHVGIGLALGGDIAEMAVAIDHLLGRAARDAQLQAATGDEVGGAGVLGHVERVLVAHVDDGSAELDALGLGPGGRQQRERRGELAGEMMDAEIGAIGADFLGRDGKIDRLQQRVGRRCGCPNAARASNGRRTGSRFSS